jgi:UDP:flavonoid glycosyltransferase YjiC (YdhE family)
MAFPTTVDQPGVAARIAENKTGLFVPLKELSVSRLSPLLDQVLSELPVNQDVFTECVSHL